MAKYEESRRRTEWFRNDRFGMFIHWGLYAIPSRGEWVRYWEEITDEDYQQYFDEFDPVNYEPKKWARIAKNAGMKYAVLTTKHHDGFCLFDSQYTHFKATNTKAGRDLVYEYVDAFRAEGIKIGFYYSLLDWHHPDYPHYGDPRHPMRNNPAYKNDDRNFLRYLDYLHNQVRELMTHYGEIDLLWFDFSYADMCGEKWEATKLVKMVRELQPNIVINDRLTGEETNESVSRENEFFSGDFQSPEQIVPSGGLKDSQGRPVTWEACITLNDNWGYAAGDQNYKNAADIIHMLVDCVSKDGNLLLNIGPTAKGEFPGEAVKVLEEIGEWMHENSESIYGCGNAGLPRPAWGRFTQDGEYLYAHIFDTPTATLQIESMAEKIAYARYLSDGSELSIEKPWFAAKYHNDIFVTLPGIPLLDRRDAVIKLKLK